MVFDLLNLIIFIRALFLCSCLIAYMLTLET